jgi:hypothetical protein
MKLSDANAKQMHVTQIGCHVSGQLRDSNDIHLLIAYYLDPKGPMLDSLGK